MAINYAKIFNRRATPQSQPIPGSSQVRNSGGGYSWAVDDWTRLDRFLILGAEGGTYYITERDLVKQNHDAIVRCIKADGIRAVNRIVEISDAGRAPKNDPAIFALALVVTHGDAQAKVVAESRDAFQAALKAKGYGKITTEVKPAGEFYYAEDYHQQYLGKNPDGYCGLGGTGVSCPVGALAKA